MIGKMLSYFALPVLLLLSNTSGNSAPRAAHAAPEVLNPGPDIITGELGMIEMGGFIQVGSNGTQVGLGMSTTICNAGNVPVDVFALPNTNHAIIPQNLYRMSGGASNDDRFEQLGHSWVKHMFASNELNGCGFGCQSPFYDPTKLDVGCSDIYDAKQNTRAGDLSSRAWVNPFTGVFQSNSLNHMGHSHNDTSHLLLVESDDLNTTLNPGATYYGEVQYLGPQEYAWCQTHPGECNMFNNVSYRRFDVTGTTNFTFAPAEQRCEWPRPSMPGQERPSIRSSRRRESTAEVSLPTK
jgi:hypothetical protein